MNETLVTPPYTRKYRFISSTDFISVPSYSIYNDMDYPELDEYASNWVITKEYGYDLLVPIMPGEVILPADEGQPTITRAQLDAMWVSKGNNTFDLGGYNKIQVYSSSALDNQWAHYAFSFGRYTANGYYFSYHSNGNSANIEITITDDNSFCPKMYGVQTSSTYSRIVNNRYFDVYDEEQNTWINLSTINTLAPNNIPSQDVLDNNTYYKKFRIRVSNTQDHLNIARLRVWGYYKKKINWFMLRTNLDGYLIKD